MARKKKTRTKAQRMAKRNIKNYGGTAKAAAANRARNKGKFKQNRLTNLFTGSTDASAFTGPGLGINTGVSLSQLKGGVGKFDSARLYGDTSKLNRTLGNLPAGVRQDMLKGGQTRSPLSEAAIGAAGLVAGKALFSSLGVGAVAPNLGFKGVQAGFTGMGKTGFDAIKAGAKYRPGTFKLFGKSFPKPQILGSGAYSSPSRTFVPGTSKLGAQRYAGATGSLGGKQTPGGIISSVVPGRASRIGMIESQAKVSPDTFAKGMRLANRLQLGAFPKSKLANTLRGQFSTGVAPGGGFGTNLGGTSAAVGGLAAGGLNLSSAMGGEPNRFTGSADASAFGPNSKLRISRTITPRTPRDKKINYDIPGIAKDAVLGGLDFATRDKFDFDNLGRPGDDKTFTDQFDTFKKSPLQQAIFSAQTGLDAQRVMNEGESAAKQIYNNYISNINTETPQTARRPIAQLFRDTAGENQTDATAMAGRAINAFSNDAENFSDDPNKLTQFLSKRTAIPNLSEENVQDLRHTFDKSVTEDTGIAGKSLTNIPYSQALGLANRITAGKVKDGVVESMGQLGLTNIPSLNDAVAVGQQFTDNLGDPDSTTAKRMGELDALYKQYGPGGGQAPTTKSIIEKLTPRGRGGGASQAAAATRGGQSLRSTEVPLIEPIPVAPQTAEPDLKSITQEAYQKRLAQLKQLTPLPPTIQQTRRELPRFNFRTAFNRDYFA